MTPLTDPTVIAAYIAGGTTLIGIWLASRVKKRPDDAIPTEQIKGWNSLIGHLYQEIAEQRAEIADLKREVADTNIKMLRDAAECDRRLAALERRLPP